MRYSRGHVDLVDGDFDFNLYVRRRDLRNYYPTERQDLDNLEEVELNDTNETRNMDELMEEINLLKKKALEKDNEVMSLKNKYKNLYQELNL